MEDATKQIVAKLKGFKQQELTFYQATEKLKQQGYTDVQITDAADQFNYTTPAINASEDDLVEQKAKTTTPASPLSGSALDRDYQKLGNSVLADKERSARPYAYVLLAIPSGCLGQQVYRFWMNRKFWDSHGDSHYLLANNLGWCILSGAIGAGVAIIILKLYFHSKDKKYKQLDKNLSNGSDS